MRRAEGDPETVGERGLKDVSHSNAAIVYQEPRTLFPVCAEAFWVKLIRYPSSSIKRALRISQKDRAMPVF
jgi:hypothetical protein